MARIAMILALLLAPQLASAADSSPPAPRDPYLERYDAAKARQDWSAAAAAMKEAVAAKPQNADYHNLYAYALRKSGTRDMDLVFKHYNEALRLDPKHRGAHEYLGEAYLMVGNLAKAKEELAALDKLCFFSCSEYRELKAAISQYEARAAK
ncbi:MAG TPA: tetratricopeptide repeat protein [Burkholderiales bacterium]